MELHGSSPGLQEPVTGHYPEPDVYPPPSHATCFSDVTFNAILCTPRFSKQSVSFIFSHPYVTHLSHSYHKPYSIWSAVQIMKFHVMQFYSPCYYFLCPT